MVKKWLYKVGGKPADVIVPLAVTAVFAALTIATHGFIALLVFAIGMGLISLYSVYYVLFVKLLIGETSFCHCKSPWDKKEYEYTDISEAWESNGKANNGTNVSYFNYRTPSGEVKRFRFLPYQYDEIAFLLERINGEDSFGNGADSENE